MSNIHSAEYIASRDEEQKYHAKHYNILKSSIKGAHHIVHFFTLLNAATNIRRVYGLVHQTDDNDNSTKYNKIIIKCMN